MFHSQPFVLEKIIIYEVLKQKADVNHLLLLFLLGGSL